MAPAKSPKVLVTGANGYIGSAVCRAFARGNWTVYGLVRRPEYVEKLAVDEIEPFLGSPGDLSFIEKHAADLADLAVVISTTEQPKNYVPHYEEIMKMLDSLAKVSSKRLLVLFTSGCKDYGQTSLHGAAGLKAHVETDPLNAPPPVAHRAAYATRVFEHATTFDVAVIRPTPVYGFTSSYYGGMFEACIAAKAKGSPVEFWADPNTIVHGMHIDDCAEAYRALVEHADRSKVAGQLFNMSGRRYETLSEIAQAMASEYGIQQGVVYKPEKREEGSFLEQYGYGFSQWVSSDKIRELTSWKDVRPMLSDEMRRYRIAYDASKAAGDSKVTRMADKMADRILR